MCIDFQLKIKIKETEKVHFKKVSVMCHIGHIVVCLFNYCILQHLKKKYIDTMWPHVISVLLLSRSFLVLKKKNKRLFFAGGDHIQLTITP